MKNKPEKRLWLLAAVLVVLGLTVRVGVSGFHFTGFAIMGCGALAAVYAILLRLGRKHPKSAKFCTALLSACVIICLLAAIVTGAVIVRSGAGDSACCDYAVVLGAGVNGSVPSMALQERIDAAYAYLLRCPEAVCILSGGQGGGEDITEAECMFRELTALGISPQRLWKEEQATSTRENIRFSLALIEEKTGVRPAQIGLISSEYHLHRAKMLAKQEQVEALGIPAGTAWAALRYNYYLREIAGVWYYTIFGG